MTIVEEILTKLEENDVKVFKHFLLEDQKNEHLIMAKDMILYYDIDKNVLNVSFHVETKPEDAAINILCLKKIKDIKRIFIMDSHIYKDNFLISGEQAYNIHQQNYTEKILDYFLKTEDEIQELINAKGYRC